MKTISLCLLLAIGAFGQEPPAAPKPQRPAPKNLKLLQPADVMRVMQAFRVSLGVQCTECHVKGDFASDENPKKEVARNMIVMTREINAKFPNSSGGMRVTCYTCHRGATEPPSAPPANAAGPGGAGPGGAGPGGPPPSAPPPPPPPPQH